MLILDGMSAGQSTAASRAEVAVTPPAGITDIRKPGAASEVVRHESVLVALRREDREFLRKLLLLFCIVFGMEWAAAFWFGPEPPAVVRGERFQQRYRVDINKATWVEWLQLDGIGPALAHRLQVDREVNGPYSSIDDLQRVSGIGPSILEQIRPSLIEPLQDQ